MKNETKTIVYILGAGHCGSTILDIILNSHSEVFSVGEIRSIHRYIELLESEYDHSRIFKGKGSDWLEVLTSPLDQQPWLDIKTKYEEYRHLEFNALNILEGKFHKVFIKKDKIKFEAWKADNEALFNAIFKTVDVKFISDASKKPHRLYWLHKLYGPKIKVLYLARDGKAVINSYHNKYNHWRTAYLRWISPSILSIFLRFWIGKHNFMIVDFKQLVQHPESIVKGICSFLDLSFESKMLGMETKNYLAIGGNRVRNQKKIHLEYREDWREQMPIHQKWIFNVFFSWLDWMNKRF